MPTLEEHQRAFLNASRAGDTEAAAAIQKDMAPLVRAEALKQAAADMGTGERMLANVGAGMTNAWEGLKQVMPGMKGATDAELQEKRQRDKALADATDTGVGADWLPTPGKLAQFAGEVAPTLAIPGVGAAGTVAQRALPRALQSMQGLARAAGTGAAGGAAAGALQPVTSDESRAGNVVLGAAGGVALPVAGAVARGLRALPSHLSAAGGQRRAPEVLRRALGDEADNVAYAAEQRALERRANQPRSVQNIPESLAEATGSVPAARVESGARRSADTAATWDDFIREQNAARYRAIEDATSEAGDLAARAGHRDAVTGPLRADALAIATRDPWFHVPAVEAVERVAAGPSSANPAVQRVADYVRSQIGADARVAMTPERLYEVRKVLADKLHGPHRIGDELSAAVKGADRETLNIIRGIDEALDASSGGNWRPYLNAYQGESTAVNASRAARDAASVFEHPGIAEIGGAPEVTLNRLRAAQNAGQSHFDPTRTDFSPRAQHTLQEVTDQYNRAGEPARVRKLTGTQGGGSQTSTDIDTALLALTRKSNLPVISSVVDFFTRGSDLAARTELSRLLQNPNEAARAIRSAQAAGRPLTQAQQMLLESASRATGVGAAGLLTAQ